MGGIFLTERAGTSRGAAQGKNAASGWLLGHGLHRDPPRATLPTMGDAPRFKRHWWHWSRWVLVGVFGVSWAIGLFVAEFRSIGIGIFGLVATAFGLAELFAPAWVIEQRRTYLAQAASWERRIGEGIDSSFGVGNPSTLTIRIIGMIVTALGIGIVVLGLVLWPT
jgi:hypothetical protein